MKIKIIDVDGERDIDASVLVHIEFHLPGGRVHVYPEDGRLRISAEARDLWVHPLVANAVEVEVRKP